MADAVVFADGYIDTKSVHFSDLFGTFEFKPSDDRRCFVLQDASSPSADPRPDV